MVCFSNSFKHQFQGKSKKVPYALLLYIIAEIKPKDRKSRTCDRKGNNRRKNIKKNYQDKKKEKKNSLRNISKLEKETPLKEI